MKHSFLKLSVNKVSKAILAFAACAFLFLTIATTLKTYQHDNSYASHVSKMLDLCSEAFALYGRKSNIDKLTTDPSCILRAHDEIMILQNDKSRSFGMDCLADPKKPYTLAAQRCKIYQTLPANND